MRQRNFLFTKGLKNLFMFKTCQIIVLKQSAEKKCNDANKIVLLSTSPKKLSYYVLIKNCYLFCRRWLWTVSPSVGSLRIRTQAVRMAICTSPSRTGRPFPAAGVARLGHQHITTARLIPSPCSSGCSRCPAWTTPDTILTSDLVTKCSTGIALLFDTASKKFLRVSIQIFATRVIKIRYWAEAEKTLRQDYLRNIILSTTYNHNHYYDPLPRQPLIGTWVISYFISNLAIWGFKKKKIFQHIIIVFMLSSGMSRKTLRNDNYCHGNCCLVPVSTTTVRYVPVPMATVSIDQTNSSFF